MCLCPAAQRRGRSQPCWCHRSRNTSDRPVASLWPSCQSTRPAECRSSCPREISSARLSNLPRRRPQHRVSEQFSWPWTVTRNLAATNGVTDSWRDTRLVGSCGWNDRSSLNVWLIMKHCRPFGRWYFYELDKQVSKEVEVIMLSLLSTGSGMHYKSLEKQIISH